MLVPLLLLATPQRATLHGLPHHAGAGASRADATLARLSTSWTIPVVFADLVTSSPAPPPATIVTAPVTSPRTRVENVSFRQVLPTTTTTTTPPPAPKAVAVALKPVPPAPKPVPPAPKPPPPTTTTTVPPQNAVTGQASWYGAPAGTCASPSLAFGTVVTVTDLATGASVRCTVDDREAQTPGRVLDLSQATFSQLASTSVGVIEVRLTW